MGNTGTKSKTTISKVSQTAIKVSNKVLQSCVNAAVVQQDMTISSGGNIDLSGARVSQRSASVVNFKCAQNTQLNQDISSAVATALKQEANSKGYDLTGFLSKTESETIAAIKTDVSLAVDNYVQQEQQNIINNTQRLKIEANGNITAVDARLSQELSLEAIAKGIADAVVGTKIVQDLSEKIDQRAEAETRSVGVDLADKFTDIFKTPAILIIVLAFVFLVIIAIGVFVAMRSGSKSGVSGNWQSKFREVLEL